MREAGGINFEYLHSTHGHQWPATGGSNHKATAGSSAQHDVLVIFTLIIGDNYGSVLDANLAVLIHTGLCLECTSVAGLRINGQNLKPIRVPAEINVRVIVGLTAGMNKRIVVDEYRAIPVYRRFRQTDLGDGYTCKKY